jgi:hypothetical protein
MSKMTKMPTNFYRSFGHFDPSAANIKNGAAAGQMMMNKE